MNSVAARVTELTGREVAAVAERGHSHRWHLYRVELADGTLLFVKALPDDAPALDGLFRAEALGLDWLGRSFGSPKAFEIYPDVKLVVLAHLYGVPGKIDEILEICHRHGALLIEDAAESFGATWDGYIGPLPMDNTPRSTWPEFYAEQRILPYLRRAADRGALTPGDVRLVEKVLDALDHLAGDPEPPARIHGDLWNGNVLWQDDGAVVIDPAAHGGHREADLAMLALFGLPYLDRVRDAYNEVAPLAEGWRARIPLHQLHPLLVHVCLFGAAYRTTLVDTARAALRA